MTRDSLAECNYTTDEILRKEMCGIGVQNSKRQRFQQTTPLFFAQHAWSRFVWAQSVDAERTSVVSFCVWRNGAVKWAVADFELDMQGYPATDMVQSGTHSHDIYFFARNHKPPPSYNCDQIYYRVLFPFYLQPKPLTQPTTPRRLPCLETVTRNP